MFDALFRLDSIVLKIKKKGHGCNLYKLFASIQMFIFYSIWYKHWVYLKKYTNCMNRNHEQLASMTQLTMKLIKKYIETDP